MIYMLLHKENNIISKLIKLQTRSDYSHASILVDSYLYEARALSGVTKTHLSIPELRAIQRDPNIDIFTFNYSLNHETIKKYLDMQVGKLYDFRSIIRFVSRVPAEKNNRYFCSELVFDAVEASGLKLLHDISGAEVSPKLLSLTPFKKKVDAFL